MCQVSDLQSQDAGGTDCLSWGNLPEPREAVYHIERPKKSRAALVSKQQLQARPYDVYCQHHLKSQHGREILRKRLKNDEYGSMNPQLEWFTEVLLVLGDSNMIWSEGLVPQLSEEQERKKPVRWPPASRIGGHLMATRPDIQRFHCTNRNCSIVSMSLRDPGHESYWRSTEDIELARKQLGQHKEQSKKRLLRGNSKSCRPCMPPLC